MKCLQKKYEKLEEKCTAAVRTFTQKTMSDPTLDFLLMEACEPMIRLFCAVKQIIQETIYIKILFIEYWGWK